MTDRKTTTLITGMFLFVIMFISLASAVTLDSSNYITLTNSNNQSTIYFSSVTNTFNLEISNAIQPYVSLDDGNIYPGTGTIPAHTGAILSLKNGINKNINNLEGSISYNDGNGSSGVISVTVNYEVESQNGFSPVRISPSSPADETIVKGNIMQKNFKLIIPSDYGKNVFVQDIVLYNTYSGLFSLGDLDYEDVPFFPGDTMSIPIIIDAKNIVAQTGSFDVMVEITASDNINKFIEFTVDVQEDTGVSPITGDTIYKPTCSLSATTFNLNNTYVFSCGNVASNLVIAPQYSDYFISTKPAEKSGSTYKYEFTPTKYGETEFVAIYKYNDGPLFGGFHQDIRISSSGSLIAGTSLKLIFTPKLDEATGDEEKYLIQLADNKTGSLVSSPRIFVNAIELNSSSETFEYYFEPNKNYEIRGKAIGYDDFVDTINIVPQKIEIRISPGAGDTLTTFSINTSVDNATITIGGKDYYGVYVGVLPGGIVEIQAKKDGYKTELINFTVSDMARVISFGGEFKKGVDQNFTLNINGTWLVYYKIAFDSQEKTGYAHGVGDIVKFTPEKSGVYIIEVDGVQVGTYEITGFSFSNKWWFAPAWVWVLLIVIIIISILVIARKRYQEKSSTSQSDGAGLNFNVGDQ